MFQKTLQDLGLNEKETVVYIALLGVDNDSVLDLAKKTNINRTTIYPILESLAQKGLVSEVKMDKKIRFHAEPLERLETFVERQKVLFEEKSKVVKDIIPQLKAIKRESGERPLVKIYEGRDGVISSIEESFAQSPTGDVDYSVYPKDLLDEIFTQKEKDRFFDLRKHIKKNKMVAIYTKESGEVPSDPMSERVRIDSNKYPICCDISINGDHVRFSTLKKSLSTVLIKNQDIAETIKSLIHYVVDMKRGGNR